MFHIVFLLFNKTFSFRFWAGVPGVTESQQSKFFMGVKRAGTSLLCVNRLSRRVLRKTKSQGFLALCTANMKDADYAPIGPNSAAGTPDKGNGFKGYHQYHDVAPVSDCGVAEYLKYRPPFKGGPKCKDLLQSPMMLSEAELVKDPKNAFVVPRKMKVTAEQ